MAWAAYTVLLPQIQLNTPHFPNSHIEWGLLSCAVPEYAELHSWLASIIIPAT